VGFEAALQCPQLLQVGSRPKEKLAQLRELLTVRDPDSARTCEHVLGWCDKSLSRIMERLPSRRRAQFARGFLEAVEGRRVRWNA
jgi:hypothetical protein